MAVNDNRRAIKFHKRLINWLVSAEFLVGSNVCPAGGIMRPSSVPKNSPAEALSNFAADHREGKSLHVVKGRL